MFIYEALDAVEDIVHSVEQSLIEVVPKDMGLDRRCGRLYIDKECNFIVAKGHNVQTLNYYGGFEYVDEEYIQRIGSLVCYSIEDDRVHDHMSQYKENTGS